MVAPRTGGLKNWVALIAAGSLAAGILACVTSKEPDSRGAQATQSLMDVGVMRDNFRGQWLPSVK